jgi:hypothetical protein
VIDNSTDLYEIYVGGGAYGSQTQLMRASISSSAICVG